MLKNYIKAARLRTLPLSISGIIVGSFLGIWKNHNHNSIIEKLNTSDTYFIVKHIEIESSLLIFVLAVLFSMALTFNVSAGLISTETDDTSYNTGETVTVDIFVNHIANNRFKVFT